MKPLITIAAQCHNFQRRFGWMLSSLVEQTKPGLVLVDVAHMPNNGQPSTESLVKFFSDKLNVKSSLWEDFDRFQFRGLVRNRQLQECETEWLLFADCDMVYHQEYFERLTEELERNHKQATYMLSSGRVSNPKEQANEMVNEVSEKTDFIQMAVKHAFEMADRLPKIPRGNVGAGFCQLINKNHAPHGGYYVKPTENRDWSWKRRGSNPKSDMQFRRRLSAAGGPRQALPAWFSDNAIHLNHDRDPEAGKHLEHQR
jgi:hypothetical protein